MADKKKIQYREFDADRLKKSFEKVKITIAALEKADRVTSKTLHSIVRLVS